MMKPLLVFSLLLTLPGASEKPRPISNNELLELRATVQNLGDLIQEQQERLKVHKLEIDALRSRLNALEQERAEQTRRR